MYQVPDPSQKIALSRPNRFALSVRWTTAPLGRWAVNIRLSLLDRATFHPAFTPSKTMTEMLSMLGYKEGGGIAVLVLVLTLILCRKKQRKWVYYIYRYSVECRSIFPYLQLGGWLYKQWSMTFVFWMGDGVSCRVSQQLDSWTQFETVCPWVLYRVVAQLIRGRLVSVVAFITWEAPEDALIGPQP